jgi:hypothetical protein
MVDNPLRARAAATAPPAVAPAVAAAAALPIFDNPMRAVTSAAPAASTSARAAVEAASVAPAGWEERVSRSTGAIYYYCQATKKSVRTIEETAAV